MKVQPRGRPLPPLAALGLWLWLCPPCAGARRLAGASDKAPSAAAPPTIAEALRWLGRTRASLAKLERSVASVQGRLALVEEPAAADAPAKEPVRSAFLQRASKLSGAAAQARTTPSGAGVFTPADGGADRACRGANDRDDSASYYALHSVATLADCKALCLREPACQGVEFGRNGRCEVWTRLGGIAATRQVAGYTCLRRQGAPTPAPTRSPTEVAYNSTATSLDDVERSMEVVLRRLSRAERQAVNATGDAPPARRDLLRILTATQASNSRLKKLLLEAERMNITLATEARILDQLSVKAGDLDKASAILRREAELSPQLQQVLNALKSKITAATNSGPLSVNALRSRTKILEAEVGNFSGVMAEKVSAFLVHRLRRWSKVVRKEMRRMSEEMPSLVRLQSAEAPAKQPPLGLDLGFADES